jgi:xylose dehydrogenase (NAD/NADP)
VLDNTFLGQETQRLAYRTLDGKEAVIDDGRDDLFGDQMTEEFDYFADRVLRDEPLASDGEYSLTDMNALAAIYEAAETGEEVTIR